MDNPLPSAREIELETLLQQKDGQLLDLTNDIQALRAYLPTTQASLGEDTPITLPPSVLSVLSSFALRKHTLESNIASTSVTSALKARVALLQQENDELFTMLSSSTIGKLHQEAISLRKAVSRLEDALKESHIIIKSLSDELDRAYDTIASGLPQSTSLNDSRPASHNSGSRSPSRLSAPASSFSTSITPKPPPTGPRAHKKPRLQSTERNDDNHSSQTAQTSRPIPTGPRRDGASRSSTTNGRQDPHGGDEDDVWEVRSRRERERERSRSPKLPSNPRRTGSGPWNEGPPPPTGPRGRRGPGRGGGNVGGTGGSARGTGWNATNGGGVSGEGRSLADRIK